MSIINRYDPLLKGLLIDLVSLMDARNAAATHSIHSPQIFKTNPDPISCGLGKIYLPAKSQLNT